MQNVNKSQTHIHYRTMNVILIMSVKLKDHTPLGDCFRESGLNISFVIYCFCCFIIALMTLENNVNSNSIFPRWFIDVTEVNQ